MLVEAIWLAISLVRVYLYYEFGRTKYRNDGGGFLRPEDGFAKLGQFDVEVADCEDRAIGDGSSLLQPDRCDVPW